ncbi:unnamed protein product, partial [Porites lobata]
TWNLTKQQILKLRTMQRAHVRIMARSNQSNRYHGNNKQTQMELGWLFGEKNGQPLDNQHYVQDAPETHKEPRKTKDEMKGRLAW